MFRSLYSNFLTTRKNVLLWMVEMIVRMLLIIYANFLSIG